MCVYNVMTNGFPQNNDPNQYKCDSYCVGSEFPKNNCVT